jgi:hypothetical protein
MAETASACCLGDDVAEKKGEGQLNEGSRFSDCQDWSAQVCPLLGNKVMPPWAKNWLLTFSMFITKTKYQIECRNYCTCYPRSVRKTALWVWWKWWGLQQLDCIACIELFVLAIMASARISIFIDHSVGFSFANTDAEAHWRSGSARHPVSFAERWAMGPEPPLY